MRWELAVDAYLNTPDSEWVHEETDTITGRKARKVFKVPELIPKGSIICHQGRGQRGDITFFGDPAPDMIPLDDEAQALSDSFQSRWAYKGDSGDISPSQSIISDMAEAMSRPVEIPGISELVETMTQVVKSQNETVKALSLRLK